jgi:L-Lysine epsilon oxidase N-terminal
MRYAIHPSVGVARVGNSPDGFYLEPETTGGRPTECTPAGEPILEGGQPVAVEKFKDAHGRIRRQSSRFRIFVYDESSTSGREAVVGKDFKIRESGLWAADGRRSSLREVPPRTNSGRLVGQAGWPPETPSRPSIRSHRWVSVTRSAPVRAPGAQLLLP